MLKVGVALCSTHRSKEDECEWVKQKQRIQWYNAVIQRLGRAGKQVIHAWNPCVLMQKSYVWFTDKPRGTRLTSDAHNDAVAESVQVTFYCTADSVPPPELELRIGNSSLGLFVNNMLTLENINASNQGTYECVPRNILGPGPTATLNLTVLGMYGNKHFNINYVYFKVVCLKSFAWWMNY